VGERFESYYKVTSNQVKWRCRMQYKRQHFNLKMKCSVLCV